MQSVHNPSSLLFLPHTLPPIQCGIPPTGQSFTNWVFSMGCQDKPAPVWFPLHGPQFLPGDCSCMGSPWATVSFRAPSTCCSVGSSQGCSAAWLHHGLFHGLLHPLEHLLPSFCSDLGVCWAVSHTFSLVPLSLSTAAHWFCPFLNMLLQSCHHPGCGARPCPVAVCPWELAGTSCVWHLQSPTARTWAWTPQKQAQCAYKVMKRLCLVIGAFFFFLN